MQCRSVKDIPENECKRKNLYAVETFASMATFFHRARETDEYSLLKVDISVTFNCARHLQQDKG